MTLPGIVSVIDRATGSIAAQFDIAEEYNFIAPTPRLPDSIDLLNFFPEASVNDFITAFGTREAANATLGNFLGVSGNFTDNTVGISKRDEIYVQSGGPSEAEGTIVQLQLTQSNGGYELTKVGMCRQWGRWQALHSKNGRYLVLSDGASTSTALSQGESEAYVILVDIEACNAIPMPPRRLRSENAFREPPSPVVLWLAHRSFPIMVQFITGNRGSILPTILRSLIFSPLADGSQMSTICK